MINDSHFFNGFCYYYGRFSNIHSTLVIVWAVYTDNYAIAWLAIARARARFLSVRATLGPACMLEAAVDALERARGPNECAYFVCFVPEKVSRY